MSNQELATSPLTANAHYRIWSDTVLGSSLGKWAEKAELQLCEMVNIHNKSTAELIQFLHGKIQELVEGTYTLPLDSKGKEVNEAKWVEDRMAELLNMANNAAGLLERLSNVHSKLSAGGRTGFAATLAKQLATAQLMDAFGPDKSNIARRRFGAGAPQVLDVAADDDRPLDLS